MLLLILVYSLVLSTVGDQFDDDWLDPYDMINYDPNTQTMRKPAESTSYSSVGTKRREYIEDPDQNELKICQKQVGDLQKQIDGLKKELSSKSQQSACYSVFKRFFSRLLKEVHRVREPTDSTDVFYDAKIMLSKQDIAEIQTFLKGEDSCRTGALDNTISQILIDLKDHDAEYWVWRFEDTFGVEIDTVLKVALVVLIINTIICTQLWSVVSWFVQFRRMFAICFFISIIWNWFYLYKIAFAEHQNNIVKMDIINKKCTGMKKIDWSDSLKEWFRSTWTLQDDPCKKYYEVLMVNPILLVPPTKAIAITITTFITDPLKHVGQGISEFLRALLKDLPVTLQIPVLITIVLAILVMMYGSVQAAFQHGIMAPLRRPQINAPPPVQQQPLQQPQQNPLMIENHNDLAGGDAPAAHAAPAQHIPRYQARLHRNDVHRRRPARVRREPPPPLNVETLKAREPLDSEDEIDQHGASPESEESTVEQSESENEESTPEGTVGATAAKSAQPKPKQTGSEASTPKKGKKKDSQNEPGEEGAAARADPVERPTPQVDVLIPEELARERTPERNGETIGHPVQETRPAEGD